MTVYQKGLKDFKRNFILYIPLSIIFQSCVGSIAAMLILVNSDQTFRFFELTLCVTFAMAYNGALYAQTKVVWIYNLLIATLLVHVALIIINIMRMA